MKVKIIAHSTLVDRKDDGLNYTSGEALLLTALRNCYSSVPAGSILEEEKQKYFSEVNGVRDADRLFKEVISKGHLSTVEHISFTFALEDVSRTLLAQLTRHRVGFSYSVKSQRYIKLST